MPKMATVLDGTLGHCWSPFLPGSILTPLALGCQVYVNDNLPMVVGDRFGPHPIPCPTLENHNGIVAEGSKTIFIADDYMPARNFDGLKCTDRIIVLSNLNVFCESPGGSDETEPTPVIPIKYWKVYIAANQSDSYWYHYLGQNNNPISLIKKQDANSPWTLVPESREQIIYMTPLNPQRNSPSYVRGNSPTHEIAIKYDNLNNLIPSGYNFNGDYNNFYPQYRLYNLIRSDNRLIFTGGVVGNNYAVIRIEKLQE